MRATRTRFFGGHGEHRFDEIGIECRTERNGLRETRSVNGGVAVETFFVEDDRDAETAVLEKELLDGISEFGHLAGVLAFSGVAGTADLTDAVAGLEGFFCLLCVEVAV